MEEQNQPKPSVPPGNPPQQRPGLFSKLRAEFGTHHGGLIVFLIFVTLLLFFGFYRFHTISAAFDTVRRILRPVIWGIALAYLLNPIMMFFRRIFFRAITKKHRNRRHAKKIAKVLSIIAAMLMLFLFVAALGFMIIPQLYTSVTQFISGASDKFASFQNWVARRQGIASAPEAYLWGLWDKSVTLLQDFMQNKLMAVLSQYIGSVVEVIKNSVSYLFYALISIIIAVYALKDKEIFQGQTKKALYAVFPPETANSIIGTARHAHNIFGGFIIGKVIDSLIIACIAVIGLWILRMPYVWLLSAIIGITNVIPFFGPFIGGIPCAILVLLTDPVKFIPFVVFIFILQQADGNIIGPIIIGDVTGLSEFWITVSLMLFGGLWGLFGMLVAVPLFAVIIYLGKSFLGKMLTKRNMNMPSYRFRNVAHYNTDTNTFVYGKHENLDDAPETMQRLQQTIDERKRRSEEKKEKHRHKRELKKQGSMPKVPDANSGSEDNLDGDEGDERLD